MADPIKLPIPIYLGCGLLNTDALKKQSDSTEESLHLMSDDQQVEMTLLYKDKEQKELKQIVLKVQGQSYYINDAAKVTAISISQGMSASSAERLKKQSVLFMDPAQAKAYVDRCLAQQRPQAVAHPAAAPAAAPPPAPAPAAAQQPAQQSATPPAAAPAPPQTAPSPAADAATPPAMTDKTPAAKAWVIESLKKRTDLTAAERAAAAEYLDEHGPTQGHRSALVEILDQLQDRRTALAKPPPPPAAAPVPPPAAPLPAADAAKLPGMKDKSEAAKEWAIAELKTKTTLTTQERKVAADYLDEHGPTQGHRSALVDILDQLQERRAALAKPTAPPPPAVAPAPRDAAPPPPAAAAPIQPPAAAPTPAAAKPPDMKDSSKAAKDWAIAELKTKTTLTPLELRVAADYLDEHGPTQGHRSALVDILDQLQERRTALAKPTAPPPPAVAPPPPPVPKKPAAPPPPAAKKGKPEAPVGDAVGEFRPGKRKVVTLGGAGGSEMPGSMKTYPNEAAQKRAEAAEAAAARKAAEAEKGGGAKAGLETKQVAELEEKAKAWSTVFTNLEQELGKDPVVFKNLAEVSKLPGIETQITEAGRSRYEKVNAAVKVHSGKLSAVKKLLTEKMVAVMEQSSAGFDDLETQAKAAAERGDATGFDKHKEVITQKWKNYVIARSILKNANINLSDNDIRKARAVAMADSVEKTDNLKVADAKSFEAEFNKQEQSIKTILTSLASTNPNNTAAYLKSLNTLHSYLAQLPVLALSLQAAKTALDSINDRSGAAKKNELKDKYTDLKNKVDAADTLYKTAMQLVINDVNSEAQPSFQVLSRGHHLKLSSTDSFDLVDDWTRDDEMKNHFNAIRNAVLKLTGPLNTNPSSELLAFTVKIKNGSHYTVTLDSLRKEIVRMQGVLDRLLAPAKPAKTVPVVIPDADKDAAALNAAKLSARKNIARVKYILDVAVAHENLANDELPRRGYFEGLKAELLTLSRELSADDAKLEALDTSESRRTDIKTLQGKIKQVTSNDIARCNLKLTSLIGRAPEKTKNPDPLLMPYEIMRAVITGVSGDRSAQPVEALIVHYATVAEKSKKYEMAHEVLTRDDKTYEDPFYEDLMPQAKALLTQLKTEITKKIEVPLARIEKRLPELRALATSQGPGVQNVPAELLTIETDLTTLDQQRFNADQVKCELPGFIARIEAAKNKVPAIRNIAIDAARAAREREKIAAEEARLANIPGLEKVADATEVARVLPGLTANLELFRGQLPLTEFAAAYEKQINGIALKAAANYQSGHGPLKSVVVVFRRSPAEKENALRDFNLYKASLKSKLDEHGVPHYMVFIRYSRLPGDGPVPGYNITCAFVRDATESAAVQAAYELGLKGVSPVDTLHSEVSALSEKMNDAAYRKEARKVLDGPDTDTKRLEAITKKMAELADASRRLEMIQKYQPSLAVQVLPVMQAIAEDQKLLTSIEGLVKLHQKVTVGFAGRAKDAALLKDVEAELTALPNFLAPIHTDIAQHPYSLAIAKALTKMQSELQAALKPAAPAQPAAEGDQARAKAAQEAKHHADSEAALAKDDIAGLKKLPRAESFPDISGKFKVYQGMIASLDPKKYQSQLENILEEGLKAGKHVIVFVRQTHPTIDKKTEAQLKHYQNTIDQTLSESTVERTVVAVLQAILPTDDKKGLGLELTCVFIADETKPETIIAAYQKRFLPSEPKAEPPPEAKPAAKAEPAAPLPPASKAEPKLQNNAPKPSKVAEKVQARAAEAAKVAEAKVEQKRAAAEALRVKEAERVVEVAKVKAAAEAEKAAAAEAAKKAADPFPTVEAAKQFIRTSMEQVTKMDADYITILGNEDKAKKVQQLSEARANLQKIIRDAADIKGRYSDLLDSAKKLRAEAIPILLSYDGALSEAQCKITEVPVEKCKELLDSILQEVKSLMTDTDTPDSVRGDLPQKVRAIELDQEGLKLRTLDESLSGRMQKLRQASRDMENKIKVSPDDATSLLLESMGSAELTEGGIENILNRVLGNSDSKSVFQPVKGIVIETGNAGAERAQKFKAEAERKGAPTVIIINPYRVESTINITFAFSEASTGIVKKGIDKKIESMGKEISGKDQKRDEKHAAPLNALKQFVGTYGGTADEFYVKKGPKIKNEDEPINIHKPYREYEDTNKINLYTSRVPASTATEALDRIFAMRTHLGFDSNRPSIVMVPDPDLLAAIHNDARSSVLSLALASVNPVEKNVMYIVNNATAAQVTVFEDKKTALLFPAITKLGGQVTEINIEKGVKRQERLKPTGEDSADLGTQRIDTGKAAAPERSLQDMKLDLVKNIDLKDATIEIYRRVLPKADFTAHQADVADIVQHAKANGFKTVFVMYNGADIIKKPGTKMSPSQARSENLKSVLSGKGLKSGLHYLELSPGGNDVVDYIFIKDSDVNAVANRYVKHARDLEKRLLREADRRSKDAP